MSVVIVKKDSGMPVGTNEKLVSIPSLGDFYDAMCEQVDDFSTLFPTLESFVHHIKFMRPGTALQKRTALGSLSEISQLMLDSYNQITDPECDESSDLIEKVLCFNDPYLKT